MSNVMLESKAMPKLAQLKEWSVYGLVFLFPIAGIGVRHWFSTIFGILVLISLWDLVKYWGKRPPLQKQEKVWLWLCAAFFFSFVVSALINGWGHVQSRSLGTEIRYLMAVPLYLMLRQYDYAWRFLLAGLFFTAPYLAGIAYYDVYELGRDRAQGEYSPNIMGPLAALTAFWLMSSWDSWGRIRWYLPLFVVAALWATAMTGSRGAFIGAIAMGLVWGWLHLKQSWRWFGVACVLLIPVGIYHASDSVEHRVDTSVAEVTTYFQKMEEGEHYAGTGAAVRLEMWRAGWLVFQDAPVFGVGRGNYTETVQQYVDQGRLPPEVAQHGHAHNAYVDMLIAGGLVGLVVFLGVLFYPLYYLLKSYRLSPESAIFGILHVTGFAVFSLTDASTFIKGNFLSIFLLGMVVFFSWHVRQVNERSG
jgi:O-antigen ligase